MRYIGIIVVLMGCITVLSQSKCSIFDGPTSCVVEEHVTWDNAEKPHDITVVADVYIVRPEGHEHHMISTQEIFQVYGADGNLKVDKDLYENLKKECPSGSEIYDGDHPWDH